MKLDKKLVIGGILAVTLVGGGYAILQLPSVQMGLMERADLATLQGWVNGNPNDWRTQYWYGKRAAEAGDFLHAEPALRAAFGTAQDFLPAGTELGKVLLSTGRTEEAFQVLRMIVGRDASQVDAQIALAQLYRMQGAEHRSMAILKEVLKAKPNHQLALFELGAAHEGVGQLADAEPLLQTCLKADAGFVPGLVLLSRVKRRQGDVTEATRLAREAVKRGPTLPAAHLELARSLAVTPPVPANRDAAIADLQAYLPQATRHPGIRLELGNLLLKKGDFVAAGEQFQEVVRLQPDESSGYFYLAQALRGLGRGEEEKRVRSVFTRLQNYERNAQDLGARIGADPENAALRYRLGELHARNGKLDRAVQAYRLGLQRDRGNEKARGRLVQLMGMARRPTGDRTINGTSSSP